MCSTCASGNLCDYDVFVCVECHEDLDCPVGELCELGSCEPPCFADADCPLGMTCNLGSNRCELP